MLLLWCRRSLSKKLPHRHRVGSKACSIEKPPDRGKPLPRIRMQEKGKKIEIPDQRPEDMETEDAI